MKLLILVFISLFFIACDDTVSTSNNIKTSYFYDNVVEGLDYKCNNISKLSTTSKNGKLSYTKNCDNIIFSIGNIIVGSIDTSKIQSHIYPSDLVNTPRNDNNHSKIIHILRVLQSLDENNNPNDGITISNNVKNNLSSYSLIDLRDTTLNDVDLQSIVSTAIPNKKLIDINTAISHYELTLRTNEKIAIDTTSPSILRLSEPFVEINIGQTKKNLTILGEPNTMLYISYDNNTSWTMHEQNITLNGDLNITLDFNNTTRINYNIYLKLKDSNNNYSKILDLNITRKDTIPPIIGKSKNSDGSFHFADIDEILNTLEVGNLNASDNSITGLNYSIVNKSIESSSTNYNLFRIDSNGTIFFKQKPNYDNDNIHDYSAVVKITDMSNKKTLALIKVSQFNELDSPPQMINDINTSYIMPPLLESSARNGNTIYNLNDTLIWDKLIAPDNDLNLTSFRFYLLDNTDKFDLNETTGILSVKDETNSLFDYENGINSIDVKFRIENNNTRIEGNSSYGTLHFTLKNVIDTAPSLEQNNTISIIQEHSLNEIYVTTVLKNNPLCDYNNSMKFEIIPSNDAFSIDEKSGKITANSDNLDFEIQKDYNLTITATNTWWDGNNHSYSVNVLVTLNNVLDEAPVIKTSNFNPILPESTSVNFLLGNIIKDGNNSDENTANLGYFIANDNPLFRIESNGNIYTKKDLDSSYIETINNSDTTTLTFQIYAKNRYWDNSIHESNHLTFTLDITNVIDNPPSLKEAEDELSFDENITTPVGTHIYNIQLEANTFDKKQVTKYNIVSGNQDNLFTINESNGTITLNNLFDWENAKIISLGFNATNRYYDNTEHNSTTQYLTININNIIEKAPLLNLPTSIDIHENISNNAFIDYIKIDSSASIDEQNITSLSIINNDNNFTLGELLKSPYEGIYYAKLFTSANSNFNFDINSSYTIELNASNIAGSRIQNLNIDVKDDIKTNIPLITIPVQYNDISLVTSNVNIQNTIYSTGSVTNTLQKYLEVISNNKFKFEYAAETFDPDTNGIIVVDLNDTHPGDNLVALKNDIKDAFDIAKNDINFSSFDKNSNNILEDNELQILFIIAGNDKTYDEANNSIPKFISTYKIDTNLTYNGINLQNKTYSIVGELNDGHQSTIGLMAKQLLHNTFNFPVEDLSNVDYKQLDVMGEGFKGADENENNGSRPIHPSCYNKSLQGWIRPLIVSNNELFGDVFNATINNANYISSTNINCIKINTDISNKYYLIEHRNSNPVLNAANTFFDNGLYYINNSKYQGGLVIWEINENQTPKQIKLFRQFNTANTNGFLNNAYFDFNDSDDSLDSIQSTYNITIKNMQGN